MTTNSHWRQPIIIPPVSSENQITSELTVCFHSCTVCFGQSLIPMVHQSPAYEPFINIHVGLNLAGVSVCVLTHSGVSLRFVFSCLYRVPLIVILKYCRCGWLFDNTAMTKTGGCCIVSGRKFWFGLLRVPSVGFIFNSVLTLKPNCKTFTTSWYRTESLVYYY